MKRIVFSYPGNESLAEKISGDLNLTYGQLVVRSFPDGESYTRVLTNVKDADVMVVCSLHGPDEKMMPLYFLCKNLKDLGANKIVLLSPYLPYMRQDKMFHPGEALSSAYFAEFLSGFVDALITVDPHLHRYQDLTEIYSVPTKVIHSAPLISEYINAHVTLPLIIGPDSESAQWVEEVARKAAAPFLVLQKERIGDQEVRISVPHAEQYPNHTPVLIDDIISTGQTMMEAVKHLASAKMKAPFCIAVHAIFAPGAYENLSRCRVEEIVTCNTVPHISNKISLEKLYLPELFKAN